MDIRNIPPVRSLLIGLDDLQRRVTGRSRPRIIYQHLPKCAGSSITLFIRRRVGTVKSGRYCELHEWRAEPNDEKIKRAKRARYTSGHFGMDILNGARDGAFVFTFLREPRQRLQSQYRFIRTVRADAGIEYMDYEEFLAGEEKGEYAMRFNAMARLLGSGFYARLSTEAERATCLQNARTQLDRMDFYGFQESFDQDFPALMRHLDFSVPKRLPRARVTEITDRSEVDRWNASSHIRSLEEANLALDREIYEYAQEQRARCAAA